MAINITALNNIQPYVVNATLINDSTTIIPGMIENANHTTGGFFGLGIMVMLWLLIFIISVTDQDLFRLTFLQAWVAASGIVTMIGIMGLVSNVFSSYQHVMWFAIAFIIGLVATYLKDK